MTPVERRRWPRTVLLLTRNCYNWGHHLVRTTCLAVLSPIMEKNPLKAWAIDAPIVLSSARIILMAFGFALYDRLRSKQPMGWPEATLAIFIVIGPAIVDALRSVEPAAVLEFGKAVVARFGVGQVANWEPHEWADGHEDGIL